jgi:hypothetical protein
MHGNGNVTDQQLPNLERGCLAARVFVLCCNVYLTWGSTDFERRQGAWALDGNRPFCICWQGTVGNEVSSSGIWWRVMHVSLFCHWLIVVVGTLGLDSPGLASLRA